MWFSMVLSGSRSTTMGWKRGGRTGPHTSYLVPQGYHFSVRCRLDTRSLQPIPQLIHRTHIATHSRRSLYNAAHATANLISCMGGAPAPPPRRLPLGLAANKLQQRLSATLSDSASPLTSCHTQGSTLKGSKIRGHAHLHARTIYLPVGTIIGRLCNAKRRKITKDNP